MSQLLIAGPRLKIADPQASGARARFAADFSHDTLTTSPAGRQIESPGAPQLLEAMAASPRLNAALKRLSSALDQLEAAAERASSAGGETRDLTDTLAVMQEDRSRLAEELDAALTRAQALEEASDEVAARLTRAGGMLRHLLIETEGLPDERREPSFG